MSLDHYRYTLNVNKGNHLLAHECFQTLKRKLVSRVLKQFENRKKERQLFYLSSWCNSDIETFQK